MSDTTTTVLIEMLQQRERTARAAYEEIHNRIEAENLAARTGIPAMSAEEYEEERVERRRASARWTEAQDALSEARRLATT